MMKEDPRVSNAQAWGCPHAPQEIFKETHASKLGDAPRIPFSINNHQAILLHTIFLSLHALCVILGMSCFYFLVCFTLLVVHNKLDPSLHCVGEKHAPLHPRTKHRFSCLSLMGVLYLFVAAVMLSC